MKNALLILALSFSASAFAANDVHKAAAPSSDKSATTQKNGQEKYHDYDNTDTIRTGQSATKREYQNDSSRSCRDSSGTWLRSGDVGYAACMNNNKMMKK